MADRIERRKIILFLAFLAFGGVWHTVGPSGQLLNTISICVLTGTYSGLILSWIISIRQRLLPDMERRYLTGVGLLMFSFIALRLLKYRLFEGFETVERYLWYLYYVPMILMAVLFAMLCIRTLRVHSFRPLFQAGFALEQGLIIPGCLLAAAVVTNDLHHLVFHPLPGAPTNMGDTGTYTYGMLFYILYVFIILNIVIGILCLIRGQRRSLSVRRKMMPFVMLGIWFFSITTMNLLSLPSGSRPYNMPELYVFGMLGVFEACIRVRLIPHNENYAWFFRGLNVAAVITDRELKTVHRTEKDLGVSRAGMEATLKQPLFVDDDTLLSGQNVRGGYVFWTEDESGVHNMNERLKEANEILATENEVLERDRELIREKRETETKSRIYAKAAEAVYPAQKEISEMLDGLQPEQPEFRLQIAKVLTRIAYVKRKSNFVILEAERETISGMELVSALEETAHYLDYCGMTVTVTAGGVKEMTCRAAIAAFDTVTAVLWTICEHGREAWVSLRDDQILIMADCPSEPAWPGLSLPAETEVEDGQLTMRIMTGGSEK